MKKYLSRVDQETRFDLRSPFAPAGDQPRAIKSLVSGIEQGEPSQVLLGVTGSGKTFTIANVIAELNRPTLVMAHNKTLAAQLYSEFAEFFPNNAVRYFVSYYDYYQPEAYLPSTDTYIEKDASINDEIDKLRHAATKSLLERRDVIVVASVSCIYGLGDPRNYFDMMLYLETGDRVARRDILKKLVELQYQRNDIEFRTGTFRVRGDVVEICPADESERSLRLEFFGDEIERLSEIDRISGRTLRTLEKCCIYPASHFVTVPGALDQAVETIKVELEQRVEELERQGKILESQRLEQRTRYDMELMAEMGFCPGIENYSRHLTGRGPGEPPPTLIDYFGDDFLTIIDESHVTVPQLGGMYRGDYSRKSNLVEHGFRLPSAVDNRPLRFDELEGKLSPVIFVSATPAEYETSRSRGRVVEQLIRPTGLLDPKVEIRPAKEQVEDFLGEVNQAVEQGERVLATTLTKRMAEDLTEYYREVGVRVKYLHSDIDTLDRIDLIRGLRHGDFDLLVGINLLREGLDLPEVALVGILDADKEGFLRSETSLVQTIGRAARHLNGRVILYADKETRSIKAALRETNRRRQRQADYNDTHGVVPTQVRRAPEAVMVERDELEGALADIEIETPTDLAQTQELIEQLKAQMFEHAKALEFEQAAAIRDKIALLERYALGF